MSGRILKGIKVLEYSNLVSGSYCTKLLADLGAEVIKIEPPEKGDDARRLPPFAGNEPNPEKSIPFLFLNFNKLSITLDPLKPDGKKIFKELVKDVDILVEDISVTDAERFGIEYDDLKEINPGLIMASLSPFGRSGPYKNYKAYQLNLCQVSEQGNVHHMPSPDPDRPPVYLGANITDFDSGQVASLSIMAALFWRGISGKGQFIEISKHEALISLLGVKAVTYPNDGVNISRISKKGATRVPGGLMPCKDGYIVVVTPEEHQWNSLMELMGNPEWSKGDKAKNAAARSKHYDEISQHLVDWMKQHTKEEIFRKGQALSCPVAPVYTAEEIVNSKQLDAREFFSEIEHPVVGKFKFPQAPYKFSKTPVKFDRAAPLLGQDNADIYLKRLGYSENELDKLREDGII